MAPASSDFLVRLFHHRWAVVVLAELGKTGGSKYVTLVNRLSISKDSLRWTLESLIEAGWVIRNPGHGHPMRPEYILTEKGALIARYCAPLMKTLKAHGLEKIGLRKWSMPVVHAIWSGITTFGALKSFLPGITPRALALALTGLQQAGLAERVDIEESEIGAYRLRKIGMELGGLLAAFLRRQHAGRAGSLSFENRL